MLLNDIRNYITLKSMDSPLLTCRKDLSTWNADLGTGRIRRVARRDRSGLYRWVGMSN